MTKNNLLVTGAAAIVALVAISGIAFSTYAQVSDSSAKKLGMGNMRGQTELTDEQKKDIEARRAEIEVSRTKIHEALGQGFVAWQAAVKQYHGEIAPILSEVTEANFAKYVEAMNYMEQGRETMEKGQTILDENGIEHRGFGMGMGIGNGKGMAKGGRGGCMNDF